MYVSYFSGWTHAHLFARGGRTSGDEGVFIKFGCPESKGNISQGDTLVGEGTTIFSICSFAPSYVLLLYFLLLQMV